MKQVLLFLEIKSKSEYSLIFLINANSVPTTGINQSNKLLSISQNSKQELKLINDRFRVLYPISLKEEALIKAIKLNDNREGARIIKEKYKDQNKYQNIDEKSIREWCKDSKINDLSNTYESHKKRRRYRRLNPPFHV